MCESEKNRISARTPNRTRIDCVLSEGIRRMLFAWLFASLVELLLCNYGLSGLDSVQAMSFLRMALVTVGVFAILTLLRGRICAKNERVGICVCVVAHCVLSLIKSFTPAFFAACLLATVVALCYARFGYNGSPAPSPEPSKRRTLWIGVTAAASALFFVFVSAWGVYRVRTLCAPTFDFGLFTQMFHSMRVSGAPLTTLERDALLSHFQVHVSPIYYGMLPFYCLFPRPETLAVLQAAILTSAVIPMWKIARLHGLGNGASAALCVLLLLFPAYSGGIGYDLHENIFLTPLLLWLFYAADRGSTPLTALFCVLTLLVKEDAAVYTAVVGLYLFLRGQRKCGAWVFLLSLAYFLGVTAYLARYGDGVMTYRYDNLFFDGEKSLLTVVKAVLLCPMKALYECFDSEKLKYIALTMLPIGFLPLLTRRYERYCLLIPYFLVNLLPDYRYQHDIFFQYSFGSTACLFYLTACNLCDLRFPNRLAARTAALALCAVVSAGCFCGSVLPEGLSYPGLYRQYESYYTQLRGVLSSIDPSASVASATYYTAYLSARDTLYDIRYCSREHLLSVEYVIFDSGYVSDFDRFADTSEAFCDLLEQNGYSFVSETRGRLILYRRQPK